MKYPKGSSVAIGLAVGAVLGAMTDNAVSMIALGFMFGMIGESINDKKKNS